ncbi:hypothetical protein [Hyalangium sp.]|uniref:hypothetical protein n=1 Tax=Hyalangium sp. TaxID=2028555 RepID=UPI002D2DE3FC|nr:hypothetical protein [Hyalangium sp.]HYH95386.1 hypothetical protein [Hyalangium sp.]
MIEVGLYGVVALASYLSQERMWGPFGVLAIVSTILFFGVRLFQIKPELRDLLAFENQAGEMARSASNYGVAKFYNMQLASDQAKRNEDTRLIVSTAASMWLCANSGASYLDPAVYRHWPAVEQRLRDNVPFKIVLLSPSSSEKTLRNLLNVGQDADDSKLNLLNLVRLYNKYPSLEIRFVEGGMYGTVFATQSQLFYDPYHLAVIGHRIENRSFCLQLERKMVPQGVGYYDLFKAHFDALWRTSTDFEDWVEANAKYHSNLPLLQWRHKRMKTDAE